MATGGLDPSLLSTPILQVVGGDGSFDNDAVQHYLSGVGIENAGLNYTVVAIMGPQSSGKSTLLNSLFGTSFAEMDALQGRQQTTKGIWLAQAPRVPHPLTLVMDLEGSDGRERGEDDTSFERQSALFALATADVLVVNMWAKDVGREAGAGKPLLKTIFQVNLKLFAPAPGARRTVLLFVFRDRTRTPLDLLKATWAADLAELWNELAKPPAHEGRPLDEFFDVQYAALANFEEKPDDFRAEAHLLRRRFTEDDSETLLRPSPRRLPGAVLGLSLSKVWEVVRENKDLNLPAHRVMVASLRCSELADACLTSFGEDAAWVALGEDDGLSPGFGWRAGEPLARALAAYDEEARYFDPDVAADKRVVLETGLADAVRPAHLRQLEALHALALAGFQAQLDAGLEREGAGSGSAPGRRTRPPRQGSDVARGLTSYLSHPEVTTTPRIHTAGEQPSDEDAGGVPSDDAASVAAPAYDAPAPLGGVFEESVSSLVGSPKFADEPFTDRCTRMEAEALAVFDSTVPDLAVPGLPAAAAARASADETAARASLLADCRQAATSLRSAVVSTALARAEHDASRAVAAAAAPLFDAAPADLWQRGATTLGNARDAAAARLETDLAGYGVGPEEGLELMAAVESAARRALLDAAREAARTALPRLRERFHDVFSRDEQGLPRSWGARSDVAGAAAAARTAAAECLAVLTVVRLPSGASGAVTSPRAAEDLAAATAAVAAAVAALGTSKKQNSARNTLYGSYGGDGVGPLDATTTVDWPGVPPGAVLLSPEQARSVWRQFSSDSAMTVQQAAATREANRLAAARGPPLWAIAAMMVLGFNEAMAVLHNPLWLLLILILVLFGKTVYNELDVEAELANGLLPGALAISVKLWPTLQLVVRRTLATIQRFLFEPDAGVPGAGQARRDTAAVEMQPRLTVAADDVVLPADNVLPPGMATQKQRQAAGSELRNRQSGVAAAVPLQPAITREVEMTEACEEGASNSVVVPTPVKENGLTPVQETVASVEAPTAPMEATTASVEALPVEEAADESRKDR